MELNPLHQAAEAGDAAAVVAELERGAEIELGTPGYHETALHRAAEHGHLSVVNALIERGCDVNAPGEAASLRCILRRPRRLQTRCSQAVSTRASGHW